MQLVCRCLLSPPLLLRVVDIEADAASKTISSISGMAVRRNVVTRNAEA